jgi:hypothetical protein
MARPLRIEFSGAWYHVMNRGIDRMKIYLNDEHKKMFLELLAETVFLFEINIHGYCLMDKLPSIARNASCKFKQSNAPFELCIYAAF